MNQFIKLRDLVRNQPPLTKEQSDANRERTLRMCKEYHEAQKRLEEYCEQNGIPVPQLVCQSFVRNGMPSRLAELSYLHLDALDVRSIKMDHEFALKLERDLTEIFRDNIEDDWEGWEPSVSTSIINQRTNVAVYFGSLKVAEFD